MTKIAIIGCGQIADSHLSEALRIKGVKIVGVCDSNKHMAKQASVRFKVPKYYTSATALLQENDIDVVHITTPPSSHLELATIAISHGCNVYMEKPFTVNLEEAKELVNTANKAGVDVCAGHNSVCDPSFSRLLDIKKQGKLGDIVHVDSRMGYNLDGPFGKLSTGDPTHWLHKLPGGLAQNNISHPLSLILSLMPGDNLHVHAKGYRLRPERYNDIRDDFYDEIRASINSDKMTANLIFSSKIRPVQTTVTAFGTKAIIYADTTSRTISTINESTLPGPFAKMQLSYHDKKRANREFRKTLKNIFFAKLHYMEGMKILFENFYVSLQGKASNPVPMSEALRVTAVMDQIIFKTNNTTK